MSHKVIHPIHTPILAVFAIVVALATNAWTVPTETVLYGFKGSPDGALSQADLIFDTSGNLYGTTGGGGAFGFGTVFKLSPSQSGWKETILYSFHGGVDGANPIGGLVFDARGNLYGTAAYGGNNSCPQGCGVVFKLSKLVSGKWSESVLHSFAGGTDGEEPHGDLVLDSGTLYGTTRVGGIHNLGIVFALTPLNGQWTKKTLHNFSGGTDDGYPTAGLTLDSHGNLYGMTTGGVGSVFKLTRTTTGGWTYKSFFYFGNVGAVGDLPQGKLLVDSGGHLYGTTYAGGNPGQGVVFELTHTVTGWVETTLYAFSGGSDGANPGAGLVRDANGVLYGTTQRGGTNNGGVVFGLTRTLGVWQEIVLHNFPVGSVDGEIPLAEMILDSVGNLYGTTYLGVNYSGVVFELRP